VERDRCDVVDPAGGFDVEVVDELELAGGGEGLAGAGDGDDDAGLVQAGDDFGEGVEDPVFVGAGGDEVLVEHGVLGFFGEHDAGFGEDVGEQGAAVGFALLGMHIVDGEGLLWERFEVGEG